MMLYGERVTFSLEEAAPVSFQDCIQLEIQGLGIMYGSLSQGPTSRGSLGLWSPANGSGNRGYMG